MLNDQVTQMGFLQQMQGNVLLALANRGPA